MAAQSGVKAIGNADRGFELGAFVEGSKTAYKIVLEAYWKGDKEALRFLCDDDVYASFAEAIDGRAARGETLENRLVRIEEVRVVGASYDHPMARISVRFDADIAAMVKDADGNCIIFYPTVLQTKIDGGDFATTFTLGGMHQIEKYIDCSNVN